jgi:hypothetical protein
MFEGQALFGPLEFPPSLKKTFLTRVVLNAQQIGKYFRLKL